MLQRQRFDPDIQVKYHQIITHMTEKNKVVQQFTRILKDLCDWEMFNSRNLDKFANSISKLLVGKDPLKDTFILFQRMLAAKSEQANKVAVSIKEDMLPFLQKAIDHKQQGSIRQQQIPIKQLRTNMQHKIRQLYSAQVNYKGMCQKMKAFNIPSAVQSRQRIQEITKTKRQLLDSQAYLSQVINIYNHSVEDYMLNYSRLCEQLSQIETNRKITIKESISKFIVFQMDAIKNIEYDLCRHAKSIQKMDDKLIIQDKVQSGTDIKNFQLSKISANNYIAHLNQFYMKQSQQSSNYQTQSQRKLNQIKRFLDPLSESYQLKKQSFTNLIVDINQLLTETIQVYDIKTVKQIVFYSNNYHMLSSTPLQLNRLKQANTSKENQSNGKENQDNRENEQPIFRRTKIPLLNAILCHPIFKNQAFWEKYNSRLNDIVQKQISNTNTRRTDQVKLSLSLLSSDIDFMKRISSAPMIQKIIIKYKKYTMESGQNFGKSTDSIRSKAQSVNSKNKNKQKTAEQKIQQSTTSKDITYF